MKQARVYIGIMMCVILSQSLFAADWNVASGSFTNADNWLPVGVPGVGGTAAITNGGTALFDGGIVTNLAAIAIGTVASNSAGTIEMSAGELSAGLLTVGGMGTGTVIQTGGKLTKMGAGGDWRFGDAASGVGSYSLSDGTLDTGGSNFQIGGWGKGYLTQTGGTLNSGQWPVVGRFPGSTGSYTLSGGVFNQTAAGSRLIVGEEGIGTFTVSGSGVAELSGGLSIGHTATGTGTVTLSTNALIVTPIVYKNNINGSGTFNFDGGTLRARGNGSTIANFMQGLSAVNVKTGGAIIDSSNNVITIAQNLLDGGGAGSLTKLGTGFLTLSGANAYSGNTMVSNGVLTVSKASALPGYNLPGKVSVNSGAALVVGVGGAGQWSTNEINSLMDNATFGADSSFGFDTTGGHYTNNADISYPLGLLKLGPNALKLSGNNTYTGSTIVYGGILQADFGTGLPNTTNVTLSGGTLSSASGSITAALGTDAGQINLVSGTTHGFSAFNTPLSVNVGGSAATLQWGSTLFNPNPLLLNETAANSELTLVNGLDLNGGSRSINVNAAGTRATITGNISNSTGTGAVTKGGAGALTLAGTNVYTGVTTVNDGTLTLASSSSNYLGAVTINNSATMTITNTPTINSFAGALTVANAGRLNVSGPSATVGAYDLVVGNAAGTRGVATISTNLSVRYMKSGTISATSAGAVYLTGGTFANVGGATAGSIDIGETGYGYFRQTGGTFTGNEIAVGYNGGGYGVLTLDGGTFAPTANLYLFCGRNGGTGYIHVNGGELVAPSNFGISWANGAGRGEVNVSGGLVNAAAGGFRFMGSTANSILNLRGGVLRTTTINKTATGASYLNLHGGKLLASLNLQNLIQNLDGAYVYPGGAVIDTTNVNVKIPQPLLAPTGNGVTSIPLTGNGAGYIGEPVVQFTGGGGTGATARALINLSLGTVTAIQITNPGFGYTSVPTVTLAGGGYTSAATLGTASIGANTSGGLTKLGSGMLTLTATNTYTGVTSISNGVLILGVATALPATANVNVAGGTYSLGGFTVTNSTVTVNNGTIENGTLAASSVIVTGSGTIDAPITGTASLVKTGSGALRLSGSSSFAGETTVEGGNVLLNSPLKHRWGFNNDLTDSVGGQTATIGGSGATWSSSQITLPGGGKGTAAFVSLGQNILPTNNAPVTIELWATQRSIQNWSRIFDFGASQTTNIIMTWTIGTGLTSDRVECKPNGLATDNTMQPYTLNQEYHIAMVITPGGGAGGATLLQWYKMDATGATLKSGSMSVNFTLADLLQTNMWLGQSEYNDACANASYNEVRIWNAALSQTQLATNSVLGPDALPSISILPETTTVTLTGGSTLNLGGLSQSLTCLSGSGLVTNGTLSVTNVVTPGGIGSINSLTIAASTTLAGTLRIDVATDGTSDLLNVQGSLSLSGLALQIENPSSLRGSKTYCIAKFTPGQLTGKFASTNLEGTGMGVVYDNVAGEIRIISIGTMIRFM